MSPGCRPTLSPRQGAPWGLTRHEGQVDGAGKALSLCLQPSDGLEVPVGRGWCKGAWVQGEGLASPGPPQPGGTRMLLRLSTKGRQHPLPPCSEAASSQHRALHSLDGDALHVLGTPGVDVALRILNGLEGRVGPVLLQGTTAMTSCRAPSPLCPACPVPVPRKPARHRCES